jgi:hypothetical protein
LVFLVADLQTLGQRAHHAWLCVWSKLREHAHVAVEVKRGSRKKLVAPLAEAVRENLRSMPILLSR